VVFENSREPIALHWPVIEFGPVPGRRITNRLDAQPGLIRHALDIELADKGGEGVEPAGVLLDEPMVDPAILDDQVRQAVEKYQIGLGPQRQVKRSGHGRFGAAGIDDNDLRVV
jgi:hypothetical protein